MWRRTLRTPAHARAREPRAPTVHARSPTVHARARPHPQAFAAGFLFGWVASRDVRRGLVYGCACGSAAVSQMGGSTPLESRTVDQFLPRVLADGQWATAEDCGFGPVSVTRGMVGGEGGWCMVQPEERR